MPCSNHKRDTRKEAGMDWAMGSQSSQSPPDHYGGGASQTHSTSSGGELTWDDPDTFNDLTFGLGSGATGARGRSLPCELPLSRSVSVCVYVCVCVCRDAEMLSECFVQMRRAKGAP